MIATRYRVFLWGDENVLKLARGGGCIVKVLNATELWTLK